jgi:hypothetical protein
LGDGDEFWCRHHLLSLLGWRKSKQKSTPIDTQTAKQWDEEPGRMAYYDKVNSLEYIINNQLKLDLTEKDWFLNRWGASLGLLKMGRSLVLPKHRRSLREPLAIFEE